MSELDENKRCLTRRPVLEPIRVLDSETQAKLGIVANVHEAGMMVIADEALKEDSLYSIELSPADAHEPVSITAECLWQRETDAGTRYWAGFRFIDVGDADRLRIAEFGEANS